jgi:hypothetical protein
MKIIIAIMLACTIFLVACNAASGSENKPATTSLPDFANSGSASSPSSSTALTYPQQTAVDMVNEILLRYQTGLYPADFFAYGNMHSEHFPDEVSLPNAIRFDNLQDFVSVYEGGNNMNGNDYAVTAMLPLGNDFGMEFFLPIPPEGDDIANFLGPDTFTNTVIDFLGQTQIDSLNAQNGGSFKNIAYDRVSATAELSNIFIPELNISISGRMRWERVNERFIIWADNADAVQQGFGLAVVITSGTQATRVIFFKDIGVNGTNGSDLNEALQETCEQVIQAIINEFIQALNQAEYNFI